MLEHPSPSIRNLAEQYAKNGKGCGSCAERSFAPYPSSSPLLLSSSSPLLLFSSSPPPLHLLFSCSSPPPLLLLSSSSPPLLFSSSSPPFPRLLLGSSASQVFPLAPPVPFFCISSAHFLPFLLRLTLAAAT
eukprot:230279-Hanusia_phi.AAC.1